MVVETTSQKPNAVADWGDSRCVFKIGLKIGLEWSPFQEYTLSSQLIGPPFQVYTLSSQLIGSPFRYVLFLLN